MTDIDYHNLNQSQFAEYAGVSRQAVSILIKKSTVVKKENGKIDIDDPVNSFYLDGRKDAPRVVTNPKGAKGGPADLPEDKPIKTKPKPAPKKRGRPKKTDPKPVKQKHAETVKTNPPAGEERPSLQKQKLELEVKKLKENVEKAKLENAKARAEVCEIDTLAVTVLDYCIALNKNLLDNPRSFVDDFEAGMKMGKSKTELTDILRKPISEAIEDTMNLIVKEIKKYKDAARRAMKENAEVDK